MIRLKNICLLLLCVAISAFYSVACQNSGSEGDNEDTTELTVTPSPTNGASNVSVDSSIFFTFSDTVDVSSVTVNTTDDTCAGYSIQISSDGFTSCIQMLNAPIADAAKKVFNIVSFADLEYNQNYKIKATTAIKDSVDNKLTEYITPGGFTTEPEPRVESPVFKPEQGIYDSTQNVRLLSGTSGAQIHYTTDGGVPDTDSNLYSSAIVVTASLVIRAIAVKSRMMHSVEASAEYIVNSTGNSPVAESRLVNLDYNTTASVTLTASDPENDTLTWSISRHTQHGTLTGILPELQYTPDLNYCGTDSLTFYVNDGSNDSNTATVSLVVRNRTDIPDGRILHGLGQYISGSGYTDTENRFLVDQYQQALGSDIAPVLYSVYQGINPVIDFLDGTDPRETTQNGGYTYLPVIGLYLFDENESKDVNAILNGDWDNTIRDIAARVKNINSSVFLRPGFEFGAAAGVHAGFTGPEFIAIWHHLRGIFHEEETYNTVWVWNTVNPETFNYMDYYPGDSVVDWWGINFFTTSQINSSDLFIMAAGTHEKPVMICESSPIQNNGSLNADNWNNWFVPYFNKIKEYNQIKAFIYISDPWDKKGFWEEWPDSRIYSNSTILENYKAEMRNANYIHWDEYDK